MGKAVLDDHRSFDAGDAHLGVAEDPGQMLPEQRDTAAGWVEEGQSKRGSAPPVLSVDSNSSWRTAASATGYWE